MVRIRPRELVASMKVDPIGVEHHGKHAEEDVHVDGQENRQQHRSSAHELVHCFIGDNRERSRIEEPVVALVLLPHGRNLMPHQVIEPLEEVNAHDEGNERAEVPQKGPVAPSTEGLALALGCQVQRQCGQHRREGDALDGQEDLCSHVLRLGVLWVALVPPDLVAWVPVEELEGHRRHPQARREAEDGQDHPHGEQVGAERRGSLADHGEDKGVAARKTKRRAVQPSRQIFEP
mmetsp:Transcript_72957/g.174015  ORF Transcript_72957/g.174015 Transcript_72957/m.174015 type:complete len:234 (-) Transcript_72957:2-703(-)